MFDALSKLFTILTNFAFTICKTLASRLALTQTYTVSKIKLGKNMNTHSSKDLEEKAWYRIAKVLYGIGWLFVILSALLTIYVLQPNTYTDTNKSYFTCPDGIKYNTKDMMLNYLSGDEKSLSSEDDQRARTTCANHQAYSEDLKRRQERARQQGVSEDEIAQLSYEYIIKTDPSNVYKLTLIESTNGSWGNAITWAIAVAVVGYGVLELIKKTAMYILTGKKFKVE